MWNNQARVSNPFGNTTAQSSSVGVFGAFGSPPSANPFQTVANPFQQPQRISSTFSGFKQGKGKGKGSHAAPSMDDDDIGKHSTARVSNPFAALASQTKSTVLSSEEAIHQYKTEVMRKKGYPFSCLGLPDEPPVITGDISPEELRWYLSQGDQSTMRLIGERSGLLGNVDFTEFLRGATTQGLPIQRVGPYKVPDSQLPSFIPRSTFRIVGEVPDPTLSSEDLEIYRTRDLSKRIPRVPPPLELR